MKQWVISVLDYWAAGGTLLIFIAVVSFGIWAYFFRSGNRLRLAIADGRALKDKLSGCQSFTEASEIAESHALVGGMGTLAGEGLPRGTSGRHRMQAMQVQMAEGISRLRCDFVVLAALTAVAPLLGLLGTVMGMIETFTAVSVVSGETGSRVADGISKALITTQFGLIVAMPGVFGLARLRRMIRYVEVLMAECRAYLMVLLDQQAEEAVTV